MVKLVGWIAVIFTILTLLFAGLMFALEAPPMTCFIMGLSSLLPGTLAVACLIPSKRFIAVRMIGIVLFVAGVVAVAMPFVSPKEGESPYRRLPSKIILVAVGASMAITGRWTESDSSNVKQSDQPSGTAS